MATITDRFRSDAHFEQMLTTIGLAAAERNRFVRDGFTNMEVMSLQYKLNVKGFKSYIENLNKTFAATSVVNMRVYFNPIKMKKIIGVVHYYDQALNAYHSIPDIDNITSDLAMDYGIAYEMLLSSQSSKEKEGDQVVKLPKLESKTWTDWNDKLLLKLQGVKAKNGFTLEYLVDKTDRPVTRANATKIEVDGIDIDDAVIFNQSAVHFGPAFKVDNDKLIDILKKNLINTPGYNQISSFINTKNGRGAYFALVASNEGEDFTERTIETAFAKLNSVFYRGETRVFGWEKYVNIHTEAHRLLKQALYANGAGMDEDTKIQHLKNNIKADAGLESSLSTARSNRRNYPTFQSFVNFMTAEVEHKTIRKKQLGDFKGRHISGYEKNTRGRGGRGRRGRGGRGGHGSYNRGGKPKTAWVDGKQVEGRHYTSDDFGALTTKQRSKVIELRKSGNDPSTRGGEKLASTIAALRDDITVMNQAIVAGVARASEENEGKDDDASTISSGKRKASSGSVGNFIANRRKSSKQD